jgi:hypothetical protein
LILELVLVFDMTAKPSTTGLRSPPLTEIVFDGSNWEDLNRLATLARLFRASGTEVDSDLTQSTWVARQFRGPALDLVTSILIIEESLLSDFVGFIRRVREHFGIQDDVVLAHQRVQLEALKWRKDCPTFFAEFDRLALACGLGGDSNGKVTLLLSKVPDKYRAILARQNPQPVSYVEHRERLFIIWATDPTAPGTHDAAKTTSKPKCGKCGKSGHTASECRSQAPSGK